MFHICFISSSIRFSGIQPGWVPCALYVKVHGYKKYNTFTQLYLMFGTKALCMPTEILPTFSGNRNTVHIISRCIYKYHTDPKID